jgi:hypothetical protein
MSMEKIFLPFGVSLALSKGIRSKNKFLTEKTTMAKKETKTTKKETKKVLKGSTKVNESKLMCKIV